MKIMPIMINKNDWLPKQQSKATTPSFNGRVIIKCMGGYYGLDNWKLSKGYFSEAKRAFLEDTKGISEEVLRAVKAFDPDKAIITEDGRVIYDVHGKLDPHVLKAMKTMWQQYPSATIEGILNNQRITKEMLS